MKNVFLSLGSNLNDRIAYLEKAIKELKADEFVKVVAISSVYETEPVGYFDQPFFLNIIVEIETDYSPGELLVKCKDIEKLIGRIQRGRWMEREIDLDIIFYNDQIIETEDLNIPHKELYNRKFVLAPLYEIAPKFQCPNTMLRVHELLDACGDDTKIKIYSKLFRV